MNFEIEINFIKLLFRKKLKTFNFRTQILRNIFVNNI